MVTQQKKITNATIKDKVVALSVVQIVWYVWKSEHSVKTSVMLNVSEVFVLKAITNLRKGPGFLNVANDVSKT